MREKSENTVTDTNGNDPFVSKNVVLCADGKYRWVYEMKLLKDFWVLGTILKIFGGIIGAGAVIFLIVELFGNHDYLGVLKMVGIMSAILLGLSVIGYLVYAAIMGGTYCVVYTMDDKGILQEQQMKQARKSELLADILTLAGALTGNMTATGTGLSSARRTSMHSVFEGTKKVTGIWKKGLTKLDSLFSHDRIYCERDDFEFVWDYIRSRCIGAKVIEK